jgi:pimeloyl-ACP methyl ester carboxylesterase
MSEAIPAYLARGDGDTAVFLLHGIGGGKAYWARQLESFAAAGYRAVAWDMPGYGESPAVEPYTFAALASALERLIDRVAAKRTVVLGHSMGGMVALEAYAQFPHKIAGLVLSGTSPAFGKPDGAWQQEFLRKRLAPLDAGKTMAELAPGLVRDMVAKDAGEAAVAAAVRVMSAVPVSTYRAALHALVTFDRRALLAAIAVPTLALAGEVDPNAPPSVMQKMAEKIFGAEYEVLPQFGHLASIEQPTRFDEAVLRFLKRRF